VSKPRAKSHSGIGVRPRRVVLLGPQRPGYDVARAVRDLEIKKKVALVTAGWQEDEGNDASLVAELKGAGAQAVNLRLHQRSEDVFARDEQFTAAYMARQERLRQVQDFYRVRLDKTDDAARTISVRHVDADLLEEERQVSIAQFRQLDQDHLQRCQSIHAAFEEAWKPGERPVIARHRQEVRGLLETCEALIIAGGHVASLLNRVKLFDVLGAAAGKHVLAWSAGAMVLTDRIVLFHDYPPYGTDIAQVLDAGLGLAPGLVLLPDPKRRVRLDDRTGIARFAERMAPATCVAMDHGASIVFEQGKLARAGGAARLGTSGEVDLAWAGVAS
jgi:hypothetical protein